MKEKSQQSPVDEHHDIHIIDYFNVLIQRLPVFITVAFTVFVVTLIYVFIKVPTYKAESKLLIDPASLNVTDIKGVYDPNSIIQNSRTREEFFETQIEVMTSERILSKVFEKLNLTEDASLINSSKPLQQFKYMFKISRQKGTFILNVACLGQDPEKVAAASRCLVQSYVKDYEERSLGFSDKSIANLQNQLLKIKQERKEAMQFLVDYKRKHKMQDLDEARQLLIGQMVQVNETMISAEMAAVTSRAACQSMKKQEKNGNIATCPEFFDNPSLTQFKLKKLDMIIEKLRLLNDYNESYKNVVNQNEIIAYIDKAIAEEEKLSMASVKTRYERDTLLQQLLADGLDKLHEAGFKLDNQVAEYNVLKDNYDAKDESYKLVLKRINELTISQNSSSVDAAGNIQILAIASVPTEIYSPNKKKVLALGFILALMLAGGICFALDYFDRTVKYKEQIEEITKLPVLGFIPKLKKNDKETATMIDSLGYLSEAFNHIRTSLGLSILGRLMKVCVITSAVQKEGKTLTAVNMALTFARADKKVLLLECDMRKPKLKKILADFLPETTQEHGLSSVLVGKAKLDDVIVSLKGVQNLDIALCGHLPPNPSELLESKNFKNLLEKAKSKYDMIFIDSPPVLHVTDSVIMAGSSIPMLFVTRVFKTEKQQLQMAIDKIQHVQGIIFGVLVNNVEKTASRQAKYYYTGSYYLGTRE